MTGLSTILIVCAAASGARVDAAMTEEGLTAWPRVETMSFMVTTRSGSPILLAGWADAYTGP